MINRLSKPLKVWIIWHRQQRQIINLAKSGTSDALKFFQCNTALLSKGAMDREIWGKDKWTVKKCRLSVTEYLVFFPDDYQTATRVYFSLKIYQMVALIATQACLSEIFQAYLQPL